MGTPIRIPNHWAPNHELSLTSRVEFYVLEFFNSGNIREFLTVDIFGSASLFPILDHESRVGPPNLIYNQSVGTLSSSTYEVSWICLLG